ncbi:MAG TPA: arginine deiminase-related protein [Polyangia bacterium]|nr:arginine deiminase-related protein [Polyangia bacterium]
MAATVVVSAVQCAGAGHGREAGCRYQVAWSINPHMVVGSVDFEVARAQHQALRQLLARAGAQVIELGFVHDAHDSVFTKDPALLLERRGGRCALLARPHFAERRQEQAARARDYEALGFEVAAGPGPTWEGGDVALLPDAGGLLLGFGQRTSRAAADWLADKADLPVTPLELTDPHLFHLDMALSVLPDGAVIACADAFAPASLRALAATGGVRELFLVPRADALAFGLNLLFLGDVVVVGARVPRVEQILLARGYRPLHTPLDQFHRAGGGAACLVTEVHRDRRVAAVADRRAAGLGG